jgi:hypothetical protein
MTGLTNSNSAGTVFSVAGGGTLTTLHVFDGTDGFIVYAGLVEATNGAFTAQRCRAGPMDMAPSTR